MKKELKKIYILSGKARSGKDTVAKMIKEECERNDLKVITLQYSSYIKEYIKKITNWDGNEDTKPRDLLQKLGTDIRENIDNFFFVNKIIDDIKVYSYFFDIVIISDARFEMEIELPRKEFENVETIYIERPNFDNGLSNVEKSHPTETALDSYNDFTHKIINNGSLNDLKNKVISIIGR